MIQPLAERMRPTDFESIIGQEHLTHPKSFFRKLLENGNLPSCILWGPPGVGKTSIAENIEKITQLPFFKLSAVHTGIKGIKKILDNNSAPKIILFIDEIHRFTKSQQDIFLHPIETGRIILIGGTTENPSFEINKALRSRCHIFEVKPLEKHYLKIILEKTIREDPILKTKKIIIEDPTYLLELANGDARKLLNMLEALCTEDNIIINTENTTRFIQEHTLYYDKKGTEHYDTISAFIKSMRGSDPNATVYWLAKLLLGGEDMLFIARHMIIFAAEDIGNANPNALLLANGTFYAIHKIGMPEARIILSQCAIYLATSTKSNSCYTAIDTAMNDIKKHPMQNEIPPSIRSFSDNTYQYPHNYKDNFTTQEYLPKALRNRIFYNPGDNPKEKIIREKLKQLWKGKYPY